MSCPLPLTDGDPFVGCQGHDQATSTASFISQQDDFSWKLITKLNKNSNSKLDVEMELVPCQDLKKKWKTKSKAKQEKTNSVLDPQDYS
jgi:hypothetical protein